MWMQITTYKSLEIYLEPSRASVMKLFCENSSWLQQLTIFAKSSIIDVLMGSKYASETVEKNLKIDLMLFESKKFMF